jgi:uncharacterized protein (TIGR03435 family)
MIAAVAVLVGLQAVLAFGQSTGSIDIQAGDLKFDAMSLKPASAQGSGAGMPYGLAGLVYANGNTVFGHNVTLEMMVGYAYKLFRQAGGEIRKLEGPDLLRSARYDLVAKPAGSATLPELRLMMRNMLAERFHLTVHVDDRLTPIYVLEAGKKGPKLELHQSRQTACLRPAISV